MTSLLCGTARAERQQNTDPKEAHKTLRRLRHIPPPSGPHTVGIVDILPESENGAPCFFRLYYPTETQDIFTSDNSWPLWLPRRQYVDGFVHFLSKNAAIFGRLFTWLGGDVYIPGLLESPLLDANTKYPVIIFSHGLGGNHSYCSKICLELASHGFIVAVPEHRDGSASMAYFLKRKSLTSDTSIEEVTPKGDYSPTNDLDEEWLIYDKTERWDNFNFRNKQTHHRADECVYILDILTQMNEGKTIANLLPTDFDFSQFEDRLDLSRLSMVGHSFGGATCLTVLHRDDRFRLAVPMDAWLFPLDDEVYESTTQPILFVNTETFHWQTNIDQMQRFMNDTEARRRTITISGTCHQSSSDFQFLWDTPVSNMFGISKKLGLRNDLEPFTSIQLHLQALLTFLRIHLDLPGEQFTEVISGDHDSIIPGPYVVRKSGPSPKKKSPPRFRLSFSNKGENQAEIGTSSA